MIILVLLKILTIHVNQKCLNNTLLKYKLKYIIKIGISCVKLSLILDILFEITDNKINLIK